MIDYVVNQENGKYKIIIPGVVPGSVMINIPEDDPRRRRYISLCLHRETVKAGIQYLQYVSEINEERANEAFFLAGLANMIKCFQATKAVTEINEKKFLKAYPEIEADYREYRRWRNEHFIHDDGYMTKTTAFLLVAPEGSEDTMGGLPSVFWHKTPVNYLINSQVLLRIMQLLNEFIDKEIDKQGEDLIKKYNKVPRDELLKYKNPELEAVPPDYGVSKKID